MCVPAAISPFGALLGGKAKPLAMLSPAAAVISAMTKKKNQPATQSAGVA